jgi:fatty-acyl-CoA synthase
MSGAAPLATDLARRIEARFGPVLYNFYGATETGFVTIVKPGQHTARPGSIGRVVPGNQVRLLDDQGRDVAPGEVGEIYVKNSMLMGGYHADESATRAATKGGFVSVGDMGRFDREGFLYLAERKADMVISGGVNIYPLEIEDALCHHPAVAECAVVGVPHAEWGESLHAFVVVRAGASATPGDLESHVRAALAAYKVPRAWSFLDALPRTPTGKVLKRELRARATAA